ncbi:hypothetical protein M918_19945 [Clostridium sp. BL8]|nr:hypothetical protein M918_19945 [Clostridium sp. BL8]
MNKFFLFRFLQIFLCFPFIMVLATSSMDNRTQGIFVGMFTFYTIVYEILLMRKSKKSRGTKSSSA